MLELTLRKANEDPLSYRVKYDGAAVGSISERTNHMTHRKFWSWGVDTMPLLGGGTEPEGESPTFEQAKEQFKKAWFAWLEKLHPGDWQRNRDHKKARS